MFDSSSNSVARSSVISKTSGDVGITVNTMGSIQLNWLLEYSAQQFSLYFAQRVGSHVYYIVSLKKIRRPLVLRISLNSLRYLKELLLLLIRIPQLVRILHI